MADVSTRPSRLPRYVAAALAVLSIFLISYLVSLIVNGGDQPGIFDLRIVGSFEIVVSALCIVRGFAGAANRAVPILLGFGLMMWGLGDLLLGVALSSGSSPSSPSWIDACYLAYFPLACVAVGLFLRSEVRRLGTPSWLDGAVAAAGAAALVAAFAFNSLTGLTGGDTVHTLTVLAYPIADVLQFSLVIGGTSVMLVRQKGPWLLLLGGIMINVVGDTSHAFSDSLGRAGLVLAWIAWPASTFVMTIAMWLPPKPAPLLAARRSNSYLIPGLSAACALGILVVGNRQTLTEVAIWLATITLALVGLSLLKSVRAMRAVSQQRRDQSLTDELTGLHNRRYLTDVLDAYFEEFSSGASPRPVALLFVDLDRFKQINDTFGHLAGDQVLRQIGPRLSDILRPDTDLLVRLGGDEFVVVLSDVDSEYAAAIALGLTDALARPFELGAAHAGVSASIGIAMAPADATDTTTLIWCADVAMYRAKVTAQPFATYRQDLDQAGDRLRLLDELKIAIRENQFVLYYQPQLDLRTGRTHSVEGLIRWQHPSLGLLAPGAFLPFAEDAGLMSDITRIVLADAIEQALAWRRQGIQLTVGVNVSVPVLLEDGFPELVRGMLQASGLSPDALIIEVTETSVISDFDCAQRAIQELSDFGIVVSVDDFGAGFTSLAYLSGLAVKELKLDRSFIVKLTGEHSQRDENLVRATIDLGHALGLTVVGEGIEDQQTLDLLTDLGCDLGQGYLISVPQPADQLILEHDATAVSR